MAKDVFQIAYNNFDSGAPDYLFWAVDMKVVFSARMVQSGEAHLAAKKLSTRDDIKESLVEYISYLHNRTRRGMGRKHGYAVMPRAELVPYHSNLKSRDHWCPNLAQQYVNQLRKRHKTVNEVSFQTLIQFLESVLQKSLQDGKHRKQKEVMLAQYATPIKKIEEDDRFGKDERKEEEWFDADRSQ